MGQSENTLTNRVLFFDSPDQQLLPDDLDGGYPLAQVTLDDGYRLPNRVERQTTRVVSIFTSTLSFMSAVPLCVAIACFPIDPAESLPTM